MKTKRFLSVFFLALLLMGQLAVPVQAARVSPPPIQAKAALLVDRKTGAVIYAQNEHDELYPASLTKIMTCLLVLEAIDEGRLKLSQEITATPTALEGLAEDGSTAGIEAGEILTVEELLYCLMVVSANEAGAILAEKISGSVESFVDRMNAKAKELGCENTHFMNPHGYHDSQHYTSAWDLYLITKAALEHPMFMTICDASSHTVPATNMSDERQLNNTNFLIRSGREYYNADVHGVKTGSHSMAGNCLVTTAQHASMDLLCVILGADRTQDEKGIWWTYSFVYTDNLYNWAFDNFSYQTIFKEDDVAGEAPVSLSSTDHVTLRPAQSVELLLPKDVDLEDLEKTVTLTNDPAEAPIAEGDVLGTMRFTLDGEELAEVDLLAFTSVEASRIRVLWRDVKEFFSTAAAKTGLGAVLVLAVAFGGWRLLFRRRRGRYGRSTGGGGRRRGYRGTRKRR
ncbi:D-alanyl-D-alanine carboxypeptidase family protein [uncultured Oscillibacter sp.]|uniref:D-alanyl-D-alanine carboxypeptidase family protein n=1 Tax=uncultured Oscillibacter sp. TaxID=876091 RepID=UPI00216ED0FB|nr:D-alanyl-D-alanine carboxypeptidase family protein [uncultured Oscillibacter sp.]MCI9554880.1 D-alanyl-D-alanine carboxypeptidase [Oscillibacter sp.]